MMLGSRRGRRLHGEVVPMRSRCGIALLAAALVLATLAALSSDHPHGPSAAAAQPLPIWPSSASVEYHALTGRVSFVGTAPGESLALPPGVDPETAPETVARAFLARYGYALGISDQARELDVTSVRQPAGRHVVRFQQVLSGVPVFAGELVVNLDDGGNMLSLGGEALPAPPPSVEPAVPPDLARELAVASAAAARGEPAASLRASEPTLWLHDSRLTGGPGAATPTLVWRVNVTGGSRALVDEIVLVDAQDGGVELRFSQLREAKSRHVCDANNQPAQLPCKAPIRTEGGPATGLVDADEVYDLAGDVYDYYFGVLGRDSVDGAGMPIKSTVRFCTGGLLDPCPWPNAGWSSRYQQMVYGQGWTHADDVAGHEITHGVTSFGSKLISYYQAGAIDESLSDVFGELVDHANGRGTDTPATRWLLGEDSPVGAFRDMKNPPAFGDPDRMTSPLYYTGSSDDGGIHVNSGVGNKAAFLMTDGGTFNGKTITALGPAKTARIHHEANMHLLTSASDYTDLYSALRQGCTNLVGTGGITSADCLEVTDAVQAVEMNVPRLDPPGAPGAATATAGDASVTLNWTAPLYDGGTAITSYMVTSYSTGVDPPDVTVGAVTSTTIGGLTNGTSYWFKVKAANAVGSGPDTWSNTVVPKASQTITFTPLADKTWGDADFTISATASSGLPVSFSTAGGCSVSGATAHIIAPGTCTVTASQQGSSAFHAAPSVSRSFAIAKAGQAISFGALPNRTYGAADFTVRATASSGLSVVFTAGGRCTVTGTRVHLTGVGLCTLRAAQPGDERYGPAPSVSRSFTIAARKVVVCRVPKVTGKLIASAKAAIARSHCATGKLTYAYSKKVAKGKVVSQSRAAGKVFPAKTKVSLVVSRGARKR
jgi:Zn-dependent metalloprotease